MQYDPIKRKLGMFFNLSPTLRKLFYLMLDLLLLRSWHIRKAIKQWEKQYPGRASILDAGSGFGQYDYWLAKNHPHWTIKGVDVKDEQVADCNAFFNKIQFSNVHFELGDLTQLDEKEGYDLVLCVDVMEHIEEDQLVLNNFYKALKPGGMLLISTPSDQGGSDVHDHDHHPNDGSQSFIDEHVRDGYGKDDLAEKMKLAGFSRTDVRYQYGRPGKLAWRLSMKYPIVMLNLSYLFFIVLPFYYLLVFPFVLVLNYFDLNGEHPTGTGLIARAWKTQ